ncbi:MAG: efflux RND transporter periplasmic adaptor subunit [Deltaproteobacteria bacterium]|nr:MAG: efflux RND transporter periplasmic adaptor subunit [Deltaproteobacteria bacterium]
MSALTACAIESGCGPRAEGSAPPPPPPTVEVVTLQYQPVRDVLDMLGQLVASESVIVKPEINGVIDSIEFEEGQRVERGDVLFRLRQGEQRARLRIALAEERLAEAEHLRTKELAKSDVSSAAQLDRAAAELEVARASVELARVELDRTEIRAPFDGVAGERWVSPGDRVSPGERNENVSGLVRVDSIETLELVFTLPEQVLPLVRTGIPVSLTVAPYPDETYRGEIFFIAPSFDPDTRRVLVKARVPNPDRQLRPGLFAQVKAEVSQRDEALLLPEAAVVQDLGGAFVWRVDAERIAHRVPIEIASHRPGTVEIRRGLRPGDVVVSVGTHKVSEGLEVRFAETDDPGVERTRVAAPRPGGP